MGLLVRGSKRQCSEKYPHGRWCFHAMFESLSGVCWHNTLGVGRLRHHELMWQLLLINFCQQSRAYLHSPKHPGVLFKRGCQEGIKQFLFLVELLFENDSVSHPTGKPLQAPDQYIMYSGYLVSWAIDISDWQLCYRFPNLFGEMERGSHVHPVSTWMPHLNTKASITLYDA